MLEIFTDALLLARLQFALTVGFHIIFPTLNIGLAFYLWYLEWRWQKTGDVYYRTVHAFLLKLFALAFGMGVVSGIVMAYQFGTNWAQFSQRGMNIVGPLLGYEVLTAFFLEAGFLGVMLFGRQRVGPKLYLLATACVALGTALSAFWILVANSWMQTPAGFEVRDGVLHATSFVEAIFNPSTPYRFAHMLMASFLTSQCFVAGLWAWYLFKKQHLELAQRGFYASIRMVAVLGLLQLVIGDLHGINSFEHQPIKVAAMEGIWETERGADLRLFAIPNQAAEKNDFEITIPNGASWVLTHSADGEVPGLKSVPASERPPVAPVFFAFRIMIGIGIIIILTGLYGWWVAARGKQNNATLLQLIAVALCPLALIATIAGWTVTEVGRQPYLVYGVFRTADGVTPNLPHEVVASSLLAFIVVYLIVLVAFFIYLCRTIGKGPRELSIHDTTYGGGEQLIQAATIK